MKTQRNPEITEVAGVARPIRVLQLMTRPIIGGSQETALLVADGLQRDPKFEGRYTVELASGPASSNQN